MRALAALALLSLLAGCLGPDADPPASAPSEPPVDVAALEEDPDEEAIAAEEAEPEPIVTSAAWEGRTASAFCGPTRCDIVEQPERSWTEFPELGVAGRTIRVTGELTWTSETPLTEELRLYVFGMPAQGEMPVDALEISGPSPIAFDVDLSGWDGPLFAFSIHGHHEAGPLITEKGQPFSMAAEITWLE